MTRPMFPLFQSHLDMAHAYWARYVQASPGPYIAVDATCGNGHDALVLAKLIFTTELSHLYCIDTQKQALASTSARLQQELPHLLLKNISLLHQCHSRFPEAIPPCDLIVYNLGYLPGGDKTKTTHVSTTLISLRAALSLIKPGGLVSMTCYPGHPSGAEEQASLIDYTSKLPAQDFLVCHHQISNRYLAPSLLLILKKN